MKNTPLPLKWKCDKRKNYNQGLSLKYQSLYPIPTFSLFWEMTQFSSILMEKFNRILFYYTILDNASISLKQRWFSKPQISTITYQLIISYSAILCISLDDWVPLGHSIRKKAFVPCHTPTPRYAASLTQITSHYYTPRKNRYQASLFIKRRLIIFTNTLSCSI